MARPETKQTDTAWHGGRWDHCNWWPPMARRLKARRTHRARGCSWPECAAPIPRWHESPSDSSGKWLLPLLAKTPEALKELAQRYLSWLDEHADELARADAASDPLLSDMAWTPSTGRSHFSCRAGLVFGDAESLREQLRVLVDDGEGLAQTGATDSEGDDGLIAAAVAEYSDGRAVAFESLFSGEARRRISLPDNPFQRNRYWVDASR